MAARAAWSTPSSSAAVAAALSEHAPAKVNLFLHVLGRRDDGYHRLDSLVVFADTGDALTACEAAALSLDITGPFAPALDDATARAGGENLVLLAARALAAAAGVTAGARLRLDKLLPVAAGIGGGSADAAAALRLLARLWDVRLAPDRLRALAATLGADVPVCLDSRAARMGGIGDCLAPAPALPPCGLALVNPGVPLATRAVFRARAGGFSPEAVLPEGWADAAALAADLRRLRNDLETAAIALCPPVGAVLAALTAAPGCLLARMSGSGATCFGLFDDASAAAAAAALLDRPGWWRWGGALSPELCETAGLGETAGLYATGPAT